MEPPTKRRREEAAGSMEEEEDRISQLPQHLLQNHILSLLPQNDAVQTCVLSKSWRHLGPTRPKLEFHRICFQGNEKFLSVVDNTLQRYDDQKLSIQKFTLNIRADDPQNYKDSISLLDKWIPIVVMNMGVKTFKLTASSRFSLPPVVFQAEILEDLFLCCCKLDPINNCTVKLPMLKRVMLFQVHIEDATLEKIMSSCPLIEHLDLIHCRGLSTTIVNKARNLKHLYVRSQLKSGGKESTSFEINDAPNIETILINHSSGSPNRYHLHSRHFCFPRLNSLNLWFVHLPTGLLNNLSFNCPSLQVLEFHNCPGLIRESRLSSLSIKRLFIGTSEHPFKAAFDVPNMLHFEFRSTFIPSISFGKTSREWKSVINVGSYMDPKVDSESPAHLDPIPDDWPLKLHEYFKALSQSRIYPNIYYLPLTTNQDTYDGGSCDPVAVNRVYLRALYSSSQLPALLNCLFRTFRPRYIRLCLPINSHKRYDEGQLKIHESRLAASIWNIVENKGETSQCDFWLQDLEESSIQVSEENAHEWRPLQAMCALSNSQRIRFRLKWRELS